MGTKAIDPQSIRNVTIIGDPDETTGLVHRLRRHCGNAGTGPAATVQWTTGHVEHTIRVSELSPHTPIANLERFIRTADGVIAVVNAAATIAPRLATMLRVADDHQVARLCLVTGLDQPTADFRRCVRTIADTRGAAPLPLQIPIATGTQFEGIINLVAMWALEPLAAEIYGSHWKLAEPWHRDLATTVTNHSTGSAAPVTQQELPLDQLHHRIRHSTRIGDIVPILCTAAPTTDDLAPVLDAIVRYLPSPMDVCQPEHALDY